MRFIKYWLLVACNVRSKHDSREQWKRKSNARKKFFCGLAVPLGEGTIGRTGWLQVVMVRKAEARLLSRRDVDPSVSKDRKQSRIARGEYLPVWFTFPNRNIPAWGGIPLMGDDRVVILTQRRVHDLPFGAMTRIHSVSRAIASPRKAIVIISLRRPSILATADRRRRSPSRNALDVSSRENPPRGLIDAILLSPCALAQFAAWSFRSALL